MEGVAISFKRNFYLMNLKHLASDFTSLSALLQGRLTESHLLQIHAHIFRLGAHQDNLVATRLIGHYPLQIALRVFNQLQAPNIFPFNAIIRVVAEKKAPSCHAISYFRLLKRQSLCPNDLTFSFVLKACIHSSHVVHVDQVHTQIVKVGYLSDSAVCNGLLAVYAKGRKNMTVAHKVFDEMSDKSTVHSWTSLIDGYAKSGLSEKALELFRLMVKENVRPDNETMVSVLSACARIDTQDLGNWIRNFTESIEDDGLVTCTNDPVNMVLSYWFGKWGKMEKSREAFERIGDTGKRSVVAWNAIIGAYVQNGCALEALSLFREMVDYPYVTPNHVTMVSALSACSQVGDIDVGTWIHEYMKFQGRNDILRTNSFLATALIDMYCKCGALNKAKEVFQSIHLKDVISINVMIMGLAVNGEGHEALKLFYEVLECQLHPNGGTFLGVLCACCHSGFVDVGRQIFRDMRAKFSIQPQLEHYACYIDLLARSGAIEDALKVAKSMPFKPNNFVWGALLGGCLRHFGGKLTQDISTRLIEVDPESSAGYVMLSNALAHDSEWREVSGLRKVMRDKGVKKQRGCSWISLNGVVHEFLAGPCSHPEVLCITSLLNGLLKEMTQAS